MQKLKTLLALCLTLNSTHYCQPLWAEPDPRLVPTISPEQNNENPFPCLSREQKEKIAVCFQENFACHQALADAAIAPPPTWEYVAFGALAGILAGILIDSRTRSH